MIKRTNRTRAETVALINSLKKQIAALEAELALILNSRTKIYQAALASIGTDASPNDVAPDELGCAETVNDIVTKALGYPAGGDVSTNRMYQALLKNPKFIKVDQALPGDIIISPTGYGNGGLSNGHVGIFGENETIMSNDSSTGKFESNYTIKTWIARYRNKGGYPIVYFRAV